MVRMMIETARISGPKRIKTSSGLEVYEGVAPLPVPLMSDIDAPVAFAAAAPPVAKRPMAAATMLGEQTMLPPMPTTVQQVANLLPPAATEHAFGADAHGVFTVSIVRGVEWKLFPPAPPPASATRRSSGTVRRTIGTPARSAGTHGRRSCRMPARTPRTRPHTFAHVRQSCLT